MRPDVLGEIAPARRNLDELGKTAGHENDRHDDHHPEKEAREARILVDRISETAERRNAPTTGPRTVPGPPNTAMMII